MATLTRLDVIADHLRRDASIAEQFALWLGRQGLPSVTALRKADAYRRWCVATRSALLDVSVDLPVDVEDLEREWEVRASESEIKAAGHSGHVALLLVVFGALLFGVIWVLTGAYVQAAAAGAVGLVAFVCLKRARTALIVGPQAAPPPMWMDVPRR
ncbi:hypothetical protein QRB38_13310 [Mycobacterium avium subsp. hominissuis]|uniref:hypothetical protein n=1 Tax=Mycobacterium TaxID=1763 RepID=UPI0002A5BA03|nr:MULTISPECIES: hypothetical protein [Mycobacterium]AGB27345.1 hypothetical protein Mycsm_07251 [Mycobacterium sp. JS623]MDO2394789.1 hypothetical protein [Mycobacterium avium subsp. hominissuis]